MATDRHPDHRGVGAQRRSSCLRPARRQPQRVHRRHPALGRHHLGARPARGDGGVRRGRRRRADRWARGVRGQLRSRQPAPDQRAVRREPQPGAGAGDRGAHPAQRDRLGVLPGDPSRRTCSASAASTANWSAPPRWRRASSRWRCGRPSRRTASPSSWCPARSSSPTRSESGWLTRPIEPTRSVVRPDDASLRRAADLLNARRERHHPRRRRSGRRP